MREYRQRQVKKHYRRVRILLVYHWNRRFYYIDDDKSCLYLERLFYLKKRAVYSILQNTRKLSTKICVIAYPGYVHTVEDILDSISFAMLEAKKEKNEQSL